MVNRGKDQLAGWGHCAPSHRTGGGATMAGPICRTVTARHALACPQESTYSRGREHELHRMRGHRGNNAHARSTTPG